MADDYKKYLSDFLEGDLPRELRSAVLRHLAWCQECRAGLRDMRAITRLAGNAFHVPPAGDEWPDVAAPLWDERSHPSQYSEDREPRSDGAFKQEESDEDQPA